MVRVLTFSVVGFVLGLLAVEVLAADGPAEAAKTPNRPNIVFILADDLGIYDLACYGRSEHHTPHLDRLASQGVRFTTAYAASPVCSPSRAAIVTGKDPARLHLTTFLPGRPDMPSQKLLQPKIAMQLPLEEITLAERLKQAGYATACIGKWHLGGQGFGPAEQGFDFVHPGKANTVPSETEGGKGEYDLTAAAERFIQANRDRPFFLYLAHNAPHIPYTARQDLIAKNAQALEPVYAAVIETLDDSVGRLLDTLDRLELADRTIVIFTSDNGGLHVPEGPHRLVTHNGPYRAGKGFVYEGGLRVPLIVRWPGHIPAGKVLDEPMIHTDWTPTILELVGLPVPEGLDGRSVAGLLCGRTPSATGQPDSSLRNRTLFWHFPHYTNQGGRPAGAVRQDQWKLVLQYETGQVELYNLQEDIGETTNLAEKQPELASRLRQALENWQKQIGAQLNTPNPDFDPDKHRALYIDVDPSQFHAQKATPAEIQRMQQWRQQMNAGSPKPAKPKPKAKQVSLSVDKEIRLSPGGRGRLSEAKPGEGDAERTNVSFALLCGPEDCTPKQTPSPGLLRRPPSPAGGEGGLGASPAGPAPPSAGQAGQPSAQVGPSTLQASPPNIQTGQPNVQTGQPTVQSIQPNGQTGQPNVQPSQPTVQPGQSNIPAGPPTAKPADKPKAKPADTRRPNVLLILADDMGYSDLGCYGGEIETPNLDRLAAGGLRFTQCYNSARCWPSRAAIMTGYYPQQVRRDTVPGVRSGTPGQRPPWAPLLSEVLRQQGYRCYHSGKWHIDGSPLDAGFDHTYVLNDHDRYFGPKNHREDGQPLPPPGPEEPYYATSAIARYAIKYLQEHQQQHADRPFFLYLCFTAPHFPLQAPQEVVARYLERYKVGWNQIQKERGQRLRQMGLVAHDPPPMERQLGPPYYFPEAFKILGPGEVDRPLPWQELTPEQQAFQTAKMAIHAAMVHLMDEAIGQVLEQLQKMGAWNNTLILFASDNGASAEIMVRGDGHDRTAPPGSAKTFLCLGPGWSSVSNTPFRRHKVWVHEGGISTPLIVHWPARIRAVGQLRHTPVHFVDVFPTVLDLLGVEVPKEWNGHARPPLPGKSMAPLFEKDGTVQHEYFWFLHEGHRAIRCGDWKLVAARDEPWELYNLANDRGETQNLISQQPEKAKELETLWNRLWEQFQQDARRDLPPDQIQPKSPARKAKPAPPPQNKPPQKPNASDRPAASPWSAASSPSDPPQKPNASDRPAGAEKLSKERPNVVFLLVDQWRAKATPWEGDPNVHTPNLDRLARQSIRFDRAISVCPVCTPYRAALLTGRLPTTTGMFLNDLYLPDEEITLAEVFQQAGYQTAYIGKWHLDGHGRDAYIPPERRQGFQFWMAAECDHNYLKSHYYTGQNPEKRFWEGYDAFAQTQAAVEYLRQSARQREPFLLFVSYGPPHFPHQTAPPDCQALCPPEKIQFPPNVPPPMQTEKLRQEAAGYYGHCAALDRCVGQILEALEQTGLADRTILVFTSDHGEMLGSHGLPPYRKQVPYDESVRVPLLVRWPGLHGRQGRVVRTPISTVDLMPTLLGLDGLKPPNTVEGEDLSDLLRGGPERPDRPVLVMNLAPFADNFDGKEYRGLRTSRYTYVRDLEGPWLLFDDQADPYQQKNLAGQAEYADLQRQLDDQLQAALKRIGDDFRPRQEYLRRWGYEVDRRGAIPYGPGAKVQSPCKSPPPAGTGGSVGPSIP